MGGVVNPPSNGTVADYAAAAKSASSNIAPASTKIGGTVTTMPASPTTVTSATHGTTAEYLATAFCVGAVVGGQPSSTGHSLEVVASAGEVKQTIGVMALSLIAVGGFVL